MRIVARDSRGVVPALHLTMQPCVVQCGRMDGGVNRLGARAPHPRINHRRGRRRYLFRNH
eukprot:scaffold909_cov121-Isochrysis_galbana.AAC.11